MNLIVDIGNTLTKFAVIDGGDICDVFSCKGVDPRIVAQIAAQYPIKRSIVSATGNGEEQMVELLQEIIGDCLLFDHSVEVPIRND